MRRLIIWCHENLEYETLWDFFRDIKISSPAAFVGSFWYLFANDAYHILSSWINAFGVMMIAFFGPVLFRYYIHKYKERNSFLKYLSEVLRHEKKKDEIN